MEKLRQLDPHEEKLVSELLERQRQLHLPAVPVCYWSLLVSKDGVDLYSYEARSKSWVRNMYNFITMQTMGLTFGGIGLGYGPGTMVLRDNVGALHESTANAASHRMSGTTLHFRGGDASAAEGIVVGTSELAESFEHHILGALCPQGTATGQLSYFSMTALTAVYDAPTRRFTQTLIRNIINNSPAAITLREIGLRAAFYAGGATSTFLARCLVARDLLDPTLIMPVGANLTARYTLEITYPA